MESSDRIEDVSALERWAELLEQIRLRCGRAGRPLSYLALATELQVHENTVMAWTKRTVPGMEHEARLAKLGGLPLQEVRQILDAARLELARARLDLERLRLERLERLRRVARPQPGTGTPVAAPARKRRRRLAALVFALLTPWGSASLPAAPVGFDGASIPLIGRWGRRYFGAVSPARA
jgi:hypothetical protein